jgi:polysaccharide pyruvyl transferase WcaK-like protein
VSFLIARPVMKILIWRVSCADTNYGEAAILQSIIDDLCKTSDVEITILSELPEITRSRYPDPNIYVLNSKYRKLLSVIRKVSETDIFIWAGGHLFHDEVSPLQVIDMLIKLSIPLFLHKPVFIWGAEFGPLKSPALRFCARHVLKGVSLITVRNPDSLRFCCELALIYDSVHLTTYPCLSFIKKRISDVPTIVHNYNIAKNRPLFGIVPRIVFNRKFGYLPLRFRLGFHLLGESFREENDKLRQILADIADYAVKELGCEVIFFPMDTNPNTSDNTFVREILKTMNHGKGAKVVQGNYQTEEILSLLKQMDLVLSMRLHGLLFASYYHVPLIAISSSEKFDRYMDIIGQSRYCISQKDLDEGDLKGLVKAALSKRDSITETIRIKMNVLQGLSSLNYKLFSQFKRSIQKRELTRKLISIR